MTGITSFSVDDTLRASTLSMSMSSEHCRLSCQQVAWSSRYEDRYEILEVDAGQAGRQPEGVNGIYAH